MNNKIIKVGIIVFFMISSVIPSVNSGFKENVNKDIKEYAPLDNFEKLIDLFNNCSFDPISSVSKSVTVKGYIKDNSTGNPIKRAEIISYYSKIQNEIEVFSTKSDSLGFYKIEINSDDFYLFARKDNYYTTYDGFSEIEGEILWVNFTLKPGAPEKTSEVKGHVRDSKNYFPIKNALVLLIWGDYESNYIDLVFDWTDKNGFYTFDVATGRIQGRASADGYFYLSSDIYHITDYYNQKIDFLLDSKPQENSLVNGYVINNLTREYVSNAEVELNWKDEFGHRIYNYTNTDEQGYYEINVAAGMVYVRAEADGYFIDYLYDYEYKQIGDYETLNINIELDPKPPKDSIVKGYVIDNNVKCVKNAEVVVTWDDNDNHYDQFSTLTDSSGYYQIYIPEGEIDFRIYDNRYYSYRSYENYQVAKNEILWYNISLHLIPPENVMINGRITDLFTDKAIINARIHLYWRDNYGHSDWNSTYTDKNGFYKINVGEGEIKINVKSEGYFYEDTGYFEISEYKIKTVDFTLYPVPTDDAAVEGFITNELTGDFIENAYLSLYWTDDFGHSLDRYTMTDSDGHYFINIPYGKIGLFVDCDDYFSNKTDYFNISKNENLIVNMSLYPKPEENSVIKGYIFENSTGKSIEDAFIRLYWEDDRDHYLFDYTHSNTNGFYSFNVGKGIIELDISCPRYAYKYVKFSVSENEIIWANFTLDKRPVSVNIYRPIKGLYIGDNKIMDFIAPVIIGDITIKVDTNNIDYVDFYLNDELVETVDSYPFEYTITNANNLKFKNTFSVKAYSYWDDLTTDEITFWKII